MSCCTEVTVAQIAKNILVVSQRTPIVRVTPARPVVLAQAAALVTHVRQVIPVVGHAGASSGGGGGATGSGVPWGPVTDGAVPPVFLYDSRGVSIIAERHS